MIGSLTGTLSEKSPGEILVEAGGVGYRVAVPLGTFGRLPSAGATVTLSIHTHVREDAISLYGFDTRRERDLFEKLIGVQGIGPRLGLALLSHLEPGELVEAIRSRAAAHLTRVPGIGPRTAERLVLELQTAVKDLQDLGSPSARAGIGLRGDLLAALENLGYRPAQAGPAVEAILGDPAAAAAPIEVLLRGVLRRLGTGGRGPSPAPLPAAAPDRRNP